MPEGRGGEEGVEVCRRGEEGREEEVVEYQESGEGGEGGMSEGRGGGMSEGRGGGRGGGGSIKEEAEEVEVVGDGAGGGHIVGYDGTKSISLPDSLALSSLTIDTKSLNTRSWGSLIMSTPLDASLANSMCSLHEMASWRDRSHDSHMTTHL